MEAARPHAMADRHDHLKGDRTMKEWRRCEGGKHLVDYQREDGWLLFYDGRALPARWVIRNRLTGTPPRAGDSNPDLPLDDVEGARAWADHVIDGDGPRHAGTTGYVRGRGPPRLIPPGGVHARGGSHAPIAASTVGGAGS
jgi:hypothetical protein